VPGHEIPLPLTVPEPLPASDTVSVWLATNVAVTARSELIVTEQVPVPLQPPPDQPPKLDPDAGEAVKATIEPAA
jgi:hypothetical protein